MSKAKPTEDDLRRSNGYLIITFTSIFLFLPVLWLIQLFRQDTGLYTKWAICSGFLAVFNVLFYFWRYPKNWLRNLLVLVGADLLILIIE